MLQFTTKTPALTTSQPVDFASSEGKSSPLGASVGSLSDSPIYEELAEEERILLIDDIFSEVLSDEGLKSQIGP